MIDKQKQEKFKKERPKSKDDIEAVDEETFKKAMDKVLREHASQIQRLSKQ